MQQCQRSFWCQSKWRFVTRHRQVPGEAGNGTISMHVCKASGAGGMCGVLALEGLRGGKIVEVELKLVAEKESHEDGGIGR